MVTSPFPTISRSAARQPRPAGIAWLGIIVLLVSCSRVRGSYDPAEEGAITYPFYEAPAPIGQDGRDDKLVIKSAVNDTVYTIEIPNSGEDYSVVVPLNELVQAGGDAGRGRRNGKDPSRSEVGSPVTTDQELTSTLPSPEKARPGEATLMDSAFGVGNKDGPTQGPSYTMGLARINDLYRRHDFEYALIETNNMITFFPTSAKLFKMKGSILVHMRKFDLAEQAWARAADLEPKDPLTRSALDRLRRRIRSLEGTATIPPTSEEAVGR